MSIRLIETSCFPLPNNATKRRNLSRHRWYGTHDCCCLTTNNDSNSHTAVASLPLPWLMVILLESRRHYGKMAISGTWLEGRREWEGGKKYRVGNFLGAWCWPIILEQVNLPLHITYKFEMSRGVVALTIYQKPSHSLNCLISLSECIVINIIAFAHVCLSIIFNSISSRLIASFKLFSHR